jgi:hypothetical protein
MSKSEACAARLSGLTDTSIADFVRAKLAEQIKKLHNPNSQRTIKLFLDYAGIDLTHTWHWNNHDAKAVRGRLDRYLKLRGDVVHRSRPISHGVPTAHPVKKEDLERAIKLPQESSRRHRECV